jgi:hypothetical protein
MRESYFQFILITFLIVYWSIVWQVIEQLIKLSILDTLLLLSTKARHTCFAQDLNR